MGKRIIFKGENFSANAMPVKDPTWYLNYDESRMQGNTVISGTNTFFLKVTNIASLGLTDKEVQYVKLYAASAGTINICKVSASGTSSILTTESRTVGKGMNIIHLSMPIVLSSTISIGFSGNGIIGINGFEAVDPIGWNISRVGVDTEYPTVLFPIDLGYLDV